MSVSVDMVPNVVNSTGGSMLGFELDFWDYVTFVTVALAGVSFVVLLVFVMGLPGRIAISRKHPDAEAVNIMGWAGFLAVVPWIQAFIWAFKPTDVVDIRRFPKEEQRAIDEESVRLKGAPTKAATVEESESKPSPVAGPLPAAGPVAAKPAPGIGKDV